MNSAIPGASAANRRRSLRDDRPPRTVGGEWTVGHGACACRSGDAVRGRPLAGEAPLGGGGKHRQATGSLCRSRTPVT
jgi:hypothetical protein